MASRVEYHSAMSRGGVAALFAAIGLWAVQLGQLTRPGPTPLFLLLLLWAGAGAIIVILARVRLPRAVKTGCIVATMGVLLLSAATTDIFGLHKSADRITKVSSEEGPAPSPTNVAGADTGAAQPGGRAATGATVRFTSAPGGDLGWADQLETRFDRRVGGPTAEWLRIEGSVSAKDGEGGQRLVMVSWSVSGADSHVRCGSTAIAGYKRDAIQEQFRQTFETAALRSNERGHAACV